MGSREVRRDLLAHPGHLMYSEVYLRLEPLGLEPVAAACRKSGYQVRLLDLQTSNHKEYFRVIRRWRPDAVGYSLNYLANIPEVIDLAKATRERLPEAILFAGGHSASHPTCHSRSQLSAPPVFGVPPFAVRCSASDPTPLVGAACAPCLAGPSRDR